LLRVDPKQVKRVEGSKSKINPKLQTRNPPANLTAEVSFSRFFEFYSEFVSALCHPAALPAWLLRPICAGDKFHTGPTATPGVAVGSVSPIFFPDTQQMGRTYPLNAHS